MNPNSAPEKAGRKQHGILIALVKLIFIGTVFYSKKAYFWLFNKCPKCGKRLVWYQIHKGCEEVRIKICAGCYRLNFLNIIVRTGFIHGFAYIAAIFLFIAFIIASCLGGCGSNGSRVSVNSSIKIADEVSAKR